jgi:hypothetical protein
MLQGVEAHEGDHGGLRVAADGEDAAFILGPVLKNGSRRRCVVHRPFHLYTICGEGKEIHPFLMFFVAKRRDRWNIVVNQSGFECSEIISLSR